jgi:hypothetical protein
MAFLSRLGWRSGLFITVALTLQFAFTSSHLVFASAHLQQLSSDPYTNSTSQHQTEVEPDTYSFGSTIVAAFQAGRFPDSSASNIGWATSQDRGDHWRHGFLPDITVFMGGTYDRVSDPSVAYDARHKAWLISSLAISTHRETTFPLGVAVLVSRSTEGGLTWNNPVTVATVGSNEFFDKEWIVCDDSGSSPFYGHCYVEWDNRASFGQGQVLMSTSTDGGKTWVSPQSPANQNFFGIGGQPVVQPSGTVVVPILALSNTDQAIMAFTSTDGGASWNKAVTVASVFAFLMNVHIRDSTGFPSAEVDGAGKVYVVWTDCRFEPNCNSAYGSANHLVMSTSIDGVTWSAVERIPIDPRGSGVNHILPGIAVDKSTSGNNAHIGLAFYYLPDARCFTFNCQLDVGFVSSTDGGAHWSKKEQLAGPMQLPWLADTNEGFMVGDYISTSIVGNNAFPVFAVATAPSDGHLNEAMYTTSADIALLGGSIPADGGQVNVASSSKAPLSRSAN